MLQRFLRPRGSRQSHCQTVQTAASTCVAFGPTHPHRPHPSPCPTAVWNKNLPHTRDLCGESPFCSIPNTLNGIYCHKVRRLGRGGAGAALLHSAVGMPEGSRSSPAESQTPLLHPFALDSCSASATSVMCRPASARTGALGAHWLITAMPTAEASTSGGSGRCTNSGLRPQQPQLQGAPPLALPPTQAPCRLGGCCSPGSGLRRARHALPARRGPPSRRRHPSAASLASQTRQQTAT